MFKKQGDCGEVLGPVVDLNEEKKESELKDDDQEEEKGHQS
jgi:hypothetical protein